jgi:class 3 adenylate cyclase
MEPPLPSGTLTLLFSDIEGSTRLLSQLGVQYGEALSVQR